jgi:hypothetical protein
VRLQAAAGEKVKRQALDYLRARIATSESVVQGRSKTEVSGVEIHDRSGKSGLEIWKARANDAEARLHHLRSGLRALLDLTGPGASSNAAVEFLGGIVSGVEGGHDSKEKPTPPRKP